MTISERIQAEGQQESQVSNEIKVDTSNTEVVATGNLVIKEEIDTTSGNIETNVEENVSTFAVPEFTEQTQTGISEQLEKTITTPSTNWQDIIKTVDKKELFKTLGISDFAVELNEYINKGGNAADYISAKAVDWNKVSDIDILFDQLKNEYPDATSQQLQRFFNKRYNQSELSDEEEREDGLLIMKKDARSLRESKIEQQSKFKIPDQVQISPDIEQIKMEAEKAQAEQFDKIRSFYETHEATKNLINSKRVAVKLGDKGAFNFNIDKPEALMQMLLDGQTWQSVTSTKQGEPDVEKLQEIALHAANPNYNIDLVNYGISLGKKMLIEEGQNARRPIGQQPSGTAEKGLVIKGSGTLKQHMGAN